METYESNEQHQDIPNTAKRTRVSLENQEEDEVSINPCEYAEELITGIDNIQKESHEMLSRWMEEFSAGENFESLCPSRLDEILQEAYMLKNKMIEQKRKLQKGLNILSQKLSN